MSLFQNNALEENFAFVVVKSVLWEYMGLYGFYGMRDFLLAKNELLFHIPILRV